MIPWWGWLIISLAGAGAAYFVGALVVTVKVAKSIMKTWDSE